MQPISAKVLLRGLWQSAPAGLTVNSVVTDSREVAPGCIFVAIRGERVDGHNFAAQAFRDGAALVIGQHPVEGVPRDKMIVVPDVLDAMIALGANYRDQYSPLLLAVTGSVGKTTTKEFCAAVFSSFGETLKTQGNQNNEIGLPKTLFRLTEDVRYAILEMGMQGMGEIRKLSLAAKPDGAVITKIGLAHVEQLGSLENILAAKMEVAQGIVPGGPLILNGDDELLRNVPHAGELQVVYAGVDNEDCDVQARHIRSEAHGVLFDIRDRQYGKYEAFIPAMGRHYVQDALLAYTAATRFGLNAEMAAAALAGFMPAGTRQKVESFHDVTLIEDFYNAGPDSMKAAIATLGDMQTGGRRIAVLGNMLELGTVSEAQHKALAPQLVQARVDVFITVGELAALAGAEAEKSGVEVHCCENNEQAYSALSRCAKPGDLVLLKASRGMKFEEILESFSSKGFTNGL